MGKLESGKGCFENWDSRRIREVERQDCDAGAAGNGSAPAILGATGWSSLGLELFRDFRVWVLVVGYRHSIGQRSREQVVDEKLLMNGREMKEVEIQNCCVLGKFYFYY